MLRKCLLGLAAVAAFALSSHAQTVDEIIAKHIEARGGRDKIKAVKTAKMSGRMTVGPGMEAPFTLEARKPNQMRIEFTVQGMTGVQAFDGTTAWMLMPFGGRKDPEALPAEDAKEVADDADIIEGPLFDYKEKGHQVELVGKEKVEGTDAFKLKITLKSGSVRYEYLDADAYLAIKAEGKRTSRGSETEFESTVGDYKEVDGLVLPHAIENGPKGAPQRQKMTIEKIEINAALDEARFKMPEAKKEPTKQD